MNEQHDHHQEQANGDRLRDYQISELQRDLRALGVIVREGFDKLEKKLDDRLDVHDKRLRDLEERVQGLEVWRTILGGLLGVLGGLAAATLWGIPFGGA